MAYFWTNTPNQTTFIQYAAQVNELAGFISDPNTDEQDAANYRAALAAAKDYLADTFVLVWADFQAWLAANGLGQPDILESGHIYVPLPGTDEPDIIIDNGSSASSPSGFDLFWDDLFRMLGIQSFLGRAAQPASSAKYNPREYIHEFVRGFSEMRVEGAVLPSEGEQQPGQATEQLQPAYASTFQERVNRQL